MSRAPTPSMTGCRQRLWPVEEPAEEREHAHLPISDLKGLMGERDFSQLEAFEKSSEHKAPFFQVGQTLEGQWSCAWTGRWTSVRKQPEMKSLAQRKPARVSSTALASLPVDWDCLTFHHSNVCLQASVILRGCVSELRSQAVSQSSYNLTSVK